MASSRGSRERLALTFAKLKERGIPALLSNSDTPATRELCARFEMDAALASRIINSNAAKRGSVPELLV